MAVRLRLGTQYRKLLLPVILEARASETWSYHLCPVGKLELGNQRNDDLI